MKRVDISQISGKDLVINLYLTQGIVLLLSILGITFFMEESLLHSLQQLFYTPHWQGDIMLGAGFGIGIVIIQLILHYILPKDYFDDGGINEKLFRYLSPIHIIFITAVIAVAEELLFRGFVQNSIGLFWTSILFTVIHFRYLHQWFMTSFVFLLSLALGILYLMGDSLIAPITAHFLIDMILGLLIHANWHPHRAGKNDAEGEKE